MWILFLLLVSIHFLYISISMAIKLAYSFGASLTVGVLLLLLLLVGGGRPIVDPTLSSKDLKADEFLTSTNFLPILSPREPKISVVFSAANLTVSLVFWYLYIIKIMITDWLVKNWIWSMDADVKL